MNQHRIVRQSAPFEVQPWATANPMVDSNVAYWLPERQARKPKSTSRKSRNWRELKMFERIVDKNGTLTDWEVVSPPYRRGLWDKLARIDVRCLACGEFYDRYLNDIVQGKSRRCRACSNAKRKAPRPEQANLG